MLQAILFGLLFSLQVSFAQDLARDLEFIETQNTQASPFNLPIYMDMDGNLSIISSNALSPVNIATAMQAAWRTSQSFYIKPILSKSFTLNEQIAGREWYQVKRRRWEFGLGIDATINSYLPMAIGFTPYKGARQTMVRRTNSQDEETPDPFIPMKLSEIRNWSTGDHGSFQSYGGVHLLAGVSYSGVTLVSGGLTLQSLFSIVINKLDANSIELSISEESLNKRRIQTGSFALSGTLNFFKGKRLSSHFNLKLDDPAHHELYELAMKGKLDELQQKLSPDSQMTEWKGSEKVVYIGIPAVAGKHFSIAEYKMISAGKENILDVRSRRSAGLFLPLRNHNKMVYQTEDTLTLFWFSEMLKTNGKLFSEKFLRPGEEMGAKGFEIQLPESLELGSTLSQMGMSFTRTEIESITPELLEEILDSFKQRCQSMELTCAQAKNHNQTAKKLRGFLKREWEDFRDELGFIMLDEPALIHSYVKSIKARKLVYFKFLNQKYQSLEGSSPILF